MILNRTLETPRLIVRPFEDDDAVDLVALFQDPLVARYVGDGEPLTDQIAALWVEKSTENLSRFGFGTGAVICRATGEFIGWAGIARPTGEPEEIIYGLAQRRWGQGLGIELAKAVTDFAIASGLTPVRATIHNENKGSAHILSRLGFALAETGYGGDPLTDLYLRPVD